MSRGDNLSSEGSDDDVAVVAVARFANDRVYRDDDGGGDDDDGDGGDGDDNLAAFVRVDDRGNNYCGTADTVAYPSFLQYCLFVPSAKPLAVA